MLRRLALPIALLALAAAPVGAATVTFDDIPGGECLGVSSGFVSDGFIVTAGDSMCINTGTPTLNSLRFAYNGTNTLGAIDQSEIGTAYTFTPADGLPFSLISVDLAEFFDDADFAFPYNAETVTVTGNVVGGGTVSTTFVLDGFNDGPFANDDFEVFVLPAGFTNLLSVEISSLDPVDPDTGSPTDGYFMIDNLVVGAASVPEPSVAALTTVAFWAAARRFSRRDALALMLVLVR